MVVPARSSNLACATLFAELVPEPENVTMPGFSSAKATRSSSVWNWLSAGTTMASGVYWKK